MATLRPTIRDVADAAGVSITTVSHVLNDVPGKRVAHQTRERVRTAALTLGYAANPAARALRTRRSRSIGFVGDEIATSPFAGEIILGAQDAVRARDAVLLVTSTAYDEDLEELEIRALLDRQVDGILYASMSHRVVVVPPSLGAGPVVVLNASTTQSEVSWVVPDEHAGGWDAAEVLLAAGHRHLAVMNHDTDVPASVGRLAGFLSRCERAGLDAGHVRTVVVGTEPTASFDTALSLLRQDSRPTGLFCFNDVVAMGAYQAAAALGLSIPHDLSVVGFDDMEVISAGLHPGLTTVALPHYEMGTWAVDQLYRIIQAPRDRRPVRTATLRGRVVHRASVASPPR